MNEPVPPERGETIRRTLIDLLESGRFSAGELSKVVGQPVSVYVRRGIAGLSD